MPQESLTVQRQINLIHQAMQKAGVWSESTPPWVQSYEPGSIPNIWQWLQFIYLPMRLTGTGKDLGYLAPKINPHIIDHPELKVILQLSIELDALTPTFQNSKIQKR